MSRRMTAVLNHGSAWCRLAGERRGLRYCNQAAHGPARETRHDRGWSWITSNTPSAGGRDSSCL